MTVLCVAPRCFVPGWHAEDCRDQKCKGCLPAVADHGLICARDYDRVEGALDEIPNLYALLDLEPGRGEPAPLGRAEAESRPPVRVDVLNEIGPGAWEVRDRRIQEGELPAAYQLEHLVQDWASRRGQDRRLPVPTVPELCRWLTANLDWASRYHLAIDEACDEILGIRGRLRPLVNGVDLAEWTGPLPGRCPACRRLTLTVEHGHAECHHPTCQRVWVDEALPESPALIPAPWSRLDMQPSRDPAPSDERRCELTDLAEAHCAHCRRVGVA